MATTYIAPNEGSWIKGSGYEKRPILGEDALRVPGTLVQDIRIPVGARVPLHVHDSCTEVFYGRAGEGEMTIGQEVFRLTAGATIICAPGQVHDAKNTSSVDWVYVVFKTHVVPDDTRWLE